MRCEIFVPKWRVRQVCHRLCDPLSLARRCSCHVYSVCHWNKVGLCNTVGRAKSWCWYVCWCWFGRCTMYMCFSNQRIYSWFLTSLSRLSLIRLWCSQAHVQSIMIKACEEKPWRSLEMSVCNWRCARAIHAIVHIWLPCPQVLKSLGWPKDLKGRFDVQRTMNIQDSSTAS